MRAIVRHSTWRGNDATSLLVPHQKTCTASGNYETVVTAHPASQLCDAFIESWGGLARGADVAGAQ